MKSLVAPKEKTHVSKETTTTKKRKAEADVDVKSLVAGIKKTQVRHV